MLHGDGTQSLSMVTAGIGAGGGQFGLGAASTTGMQQSNLAATVAPPPEDPPKAAGCVTIIIATFVGLVAIANDGFAALGIVILFGGAIVAAVVDQSAKSSYSEHEYAVQLMAWRRKYLCTVCGTTRELPEKGAAI